MQIFPRLNPARRLGCLSTADFAPRFLLRRQNPSYQLWLRLRRTASPEAKQQKQPSESSCPICGTTGLIRPGSPPSRLLCLRRRFWIANRCFTGDGPRRHPTRSNCPRARPTVPLIQWANFRPLDPTGLKIRTL